MIRPGKFRIACTQAVTYALRAASLLLLLIGAAAAQTPAGTSSVGDAVENALRRGQITLPGAHPFHLQAHISAEGNSRAEYSADVEEYWVSPSKWRRAVKSAEFSQTLISNGDQLSEQDTGDYYPFWLHDLVTALFDPLPMADQLKRMRAPLEVPDDSVKSNSCLNVQAKVGIAPAQNTLGYAFCFGGKGGLLQSVTTPGYHARFADYQKFGDKMVARSVTAEFGPLTIDAKITELKELAAPDETLFAIEKPTPTSEQVRSTQVGEDIARALAVNTPA
ncbi:MAG TPA: hypothetical protein VFT65_18590, partial [Candidatus Angelobacter sp.]|nr:hypothetical protein [Candidatus Angelobacter sp.]